MQRPIHRPHINTRCTWGFGHALGEIMCVFIISPAVLNCNFPLEINYQAVQMFHTVAPPWKQASVSD